MTTISGELQTEQIESSRELPGRSSIKLFTFIRFRAAILLVFILFLLTGPVPQSSDIIAAVLAYSLLALTLLLCLGTLVFGLATRNRMELRFLIQDQQGNRSRYPLSASPLPCVLQVSRASVPPFFSLSLRVKFLEPSLTTLHHVLLGSVKSKRFVNENIRFPHRGRWHIASIEVSLEDQFGLFSLQWSLPNYGLYSDILLSPGEFEQCKAPLLSSSFRTGDDSPHTDKRQGEPFDLKPYHPSDGMRKILWKIYAKTGELISRHPEQSMTPEGKSFLFVLAYKEQDVLCSHALAYLRLLEDSRIDFHVGCLGMESHAIAQTRAEAEDLLIETAWNTSNALPEKDLQTLIESASAYSQSSLSRVIFFLDPSTPKENFLDTVIQLGIFLERKGISPVFISPDHQELQHVKVKQSLIKKTFSTLLYSEHGEPLHEPSSQHRELVHHCAQHSWELILI